jgi:hypothetical protein
MPKKPLEVHEKVKDLIREGCLNKEIKKIVDVSDSFISNRRKELKEEDKIKDEKTTDSNDIKISKKSLEILYRIQGMYGHDTIDETVSTIFEDYKQIMKGKFEYDMDNEKTAGEVFSNFRDELDKLYKMSDNQKQIEFYKSLDQDDKVIDHYFGALMIGYKKTFFEFIAENIIEHCEKCKSMRIFTYHGNLFVSKEVEEESKRYAYKIKIPK